MSTLIADKNISIELSKELQHLEAKSMQCQAPITWQKAEGHFVYDVDDKQYIDFTSGVLIANVGHSHPKIKKAIIDQVNSNLLTSYLFPNMPRVELLQRLHAHIPTGYKTALFSTGSEAVEVCLKVAKIWATQKHPKKKYVISFDNSFHGRTMGAQLMGGYPNLKGWVDPVKYYVTLPYPDKIYSNQLNFNDFLKSLADKNIAPEEICSVITESFQGGTAAFAPAEFMLQLREWCTQNDILLILDEIQSGFCRTGKWWGFEHYNITPDLFACGKGLSSSLPISCVVGRADLLDCVDTGTMTTTHSANPICCRAAIANIDILETEGMMENAARMGIIVETFLHDKLAHLKHIYKLNGKGLVFGLHFISTDNVTVYPNIAKEAVRIASKNNVLLFSPVGPGGATIKLCPPLCIDEETLIKGLTILTGAIEEAHLKESAID